MWYTGRTLRLSQIIASVCVEARSLFMMPLCFDTLTALSSTYCLKRGRTKNEAKETLLRKRKVLHLLSQWIALCRDTLQDDEHTKVFMKVNAVNQ